MRKSTFEKNKFDMMKAKALAYDVDPEGDYMRLGNTPAEEAFQLLKCGFEMMMIMSSIYFPTLDRRSQRKGPKWLESGVLYHGENGMMVLARAAPALMARADGGVEVDKPPEITASHHLELFDQVQSFYPLPKAHGDSIAKMEAEFKVMEKKEPRREVLDGEEPPNEYSQALMRGENPDDDPELVERQREYATDYFIDLALHFGVSRALDRNDNKILKQKWARLPKLQEPLASRHRARLREAWREGIKPYLAYARLGAQ
jgi:hypothetical protein